MNKLYLIGAIILFGHLSINAQTEGVSIQEAIAIHEQIGVVEGNTVSESNNIYIKSKVAVDKITDKYNYKLTTDCFEERVDFYRYVFYKNCKLDDFDLPIPLNKNTASIIAITDTGRLVIITYNQSIYNHYISQIKSLGFKQKENQKDYYIKDNLIASLYSYNGEYRIKIWKK